jgi:3-deoxy-D-manno-octulosonic acid (KDO) 8-phosphate synthase
MTRRTHVGQMFRGPGIDEGLRILSEVKRQSDAV